MYWMDRDHIINPQNDDACMLDMVITKCAPIIFSKKPSVLITVHNRHYACGQNHCAVWDRYKHGIAAQLGVSFVEMRRRDNAIALLLYDAGVLLQTLREETHTAFLMQYGYEAGCSVEEHLAHLMYRYSRTHFPHEVGVFLGYPLNDVKGFINKREPMRSTGKRWQVFGCDGESERLMQCYDLAEAAMKKVISEHAPRLRRGVCRRAELERYCMQYITQDLVA